MLKQIDTALNRLIGIGIYFVGFTTIYGGSFVSISDPALRFAKQSVYEAEFLFPMEHWHNHASCIVETPNGDLLVCWFHGSGERTADDVKIEGARLKHAEKTWSHRFTMADTLNYPDTNCTMFIDPQGRLWLLWPTILANRWETALMKYRISTNYTGDGPPLWSVNEILHVTPGEEFVTATDAWLAKVEANKSLPEERIQVYL